MSLQFSQWIYLVTFICFKGYCSSLPGSMAWVLGKSWGVPCPRRPPLNDVIGSVLTLSSSGTCLSSGTTAYLVLYCQYSCETLKFLMKMGWRRAGFMDLPWYVPLWLFHVHPTLHLPNAGYIWITMDKMKDLLSWLTVSFNSCTSQIPSSLLYILIEC